MNPLNPFVEDIYRTSLRPAPVLFKIDLWASDTEPCIVWKSTVRVSTKNRTLNSFRLEGIKKSPGAHERLPTACICSAKRTDARKTDIFLIYLQDPQIDAYIVSIESKFGSSRVDSSVGLSIGAGLRGYILGYIVSCVRSPRRHASYRYHAPRSNKREVRYSRRPAATSSINNKPSGVE